jgi:hypothetical protein
MVFTLEYGNKEAQYEQKPFNNRKNPTEWTPMKSAKFRDTEKVFKSLYMGMLKAYSLVTVLLVSR